MENHCLVINPEKTEQEAFIRLVSRLTNVETLGFQTEEEALRWLEKEAQNVLALLSPWELSAENSNFREKVQKTDNARNALHFFTSSTHDEEWLGPVLQNIKIAGEVPLDTARVAHFLHHIQSIMIPSGNSKNKALVVDDDSATREIIGSYLVSFGFSHISYAENGEHALRLLAQNPSPFSLILSDWQMPQMNGLELLKNVRSNPFTSRIPFVIVTAKTPVEPIKTIQASDSGVTGYLLKPFTMKSFHAQLDAALNTLSRQKSAESFLVAGRLMQAKGNPHGADVVLKEGIQSFPENFLILEALGDVCAMRHSDPHHLSMAVEHYEKALAKNSLNTGLFAKAFEALTSLGRMNDAVRLLRTYQPRANRDDAFRTRLGRIFLRNGYPDLASAEFDRAISANPENNEAQTLKKVAEDSLAQPHRKKSA